MENIIHVIQGGFIIRLTFKDDCSGCGLCVTVCIMDNIGLDDGMAFETGNGNCFNCGHCMAVCPQNNIILNEYKDKLNTIVEYDSGDVSLSQDDYLNFLNQRRSIRWFKNKKIDRKTFGELFRAAYNSPTARNMQDVEFVVLDDELDEFMNLVYEIIRAEEDEYLRIKQFGEYLRGEGNYKNHPLLWEGKQLLLTFSNDKLNAGIAATRLELLAYAMGLGGFYSGFILEADRLDHGRLMEFFPDIDKSKHMNCAFVIGYPRVRYRRTVPRNDVKVGYR